VSDLLEWRKHDTSTETTFTEFGQYMVERLAGDNFRIWLPDGAKNATIMAVGFASKDAARAACQSNLDGRRALETVEVLRQSEAAVATLCISSQAEIERLKTALSKIDAIRNSIIGYQTVGWSQHIYPLVSALEEAGYHGEGYEKSRETAKTQVDLINELMAENASLRARSGGKS
jgi:hypothetical protein